MGAICSGILANRFTTLSSWKLFTTDGADQQIVSLTQDLKTQGSSSPQHQVGGEGIEVKTHFVKYQSFYSYFPFFS